MNRRNFLVYILTASMVGRLDWDLRRVNIVKDSVGRWYL